ISFIRMSSSEDAVISARSSWLCSSQKQLSDVLTTTQYNSPSDDCRCDPVCLQRAEEGLPCVVTLLCTPNSASVISSLQVVSEARTIEVYSLSGEYCGTCRGEHVQKSHTDGYFYLIFSSLIGSFLHLLRGRYYSIFFCLLNKSDMLNGFIPLLMGGGALSCLSRGGGASSSAGAESGPNLPSGLGQLLSTSNQNQTPGAMSAMLSSETGTINPDLLPMLQSVCGQVTQLRLEEATSQERKKNGEREGHICCVGFEKILETVVEKRMDEMERRLKEHLDLRLDALQQRLEITLQQALSHKKHQ
uniref:Uncharacterized protein n=1 Tax=Sinocyclocheilus anshuiensis TaxID=1608454 RepID=A0A671STT5_9TELE